MDYNKYKKSYNFRMLGTYMPLVPLEDWICFASGFW